MGKLDPYSGVVPWAWQRGIDHRSKFWVGGAAFSVLLAGLRLNGLIGVAVGAAILGGLTTAFAVLVAPYEQRNMLQRARGPATPAGR